MMSRERSWSAIAALGALFAVHVNSCSLINLAVGVELQSRRLGRSTYERKGWMVRRDGSKLDLIEVRDLALSGELPLATALRMETDAGERSIPVNRIAMIGATPARHAALKGFLVGLGADVLVVAVVASVQSSGGCSFSPNIDLGGFSDRSPAADPPNSRRTPSPAH